MQPFEYSRATDVSHALTSGAKPQTKFVAGGTNLIDLMKCEVERPARLVDINALPLATIEIVKGGIRIGALARMTDVAADALVRQHAPAISQALLASASPQLRNAASIGGNLMQRTRCPYFRELTWTPCNKRNPGSGCSAIQGDNRMHAILGTSEHCIATHPSDFAVAVAALDGVIALRGPSGERHVAAVDFHLLPGSTPQLEHAMKHDELITSVFIPDAPHTRQSSYLKVRDRASYEFALSSAAVGLNVENGVLRSARIALGGVGTKPWRAHVAEAELAGQKVSIAAFRRAADSEMRTARGYGHNDFKIELAKRTLVRALTDLAGGAA
jgi:xanthine dehydrogenase YagS FAD-binding subunit